MRHPRSTTCQGFVLPECEWVGLCLFAVMKRCVFIERDGILNEVRVGPKNQITPLTLEELKLNLNADGPLRRLKEAGFVLVVTTNQPGLSRGYQSRREIDRMHDLL